MRAPKILVQLADAGKLGQTQPVLVAEPIEVPMPDKAALAQLALRLLAARRRRSAFLPAPLLGEPGYDMLLDLFAHDAERPQRTVGDICLSAGSAVTTAQRWLYELEHRRLVTRRIDSADRRRALISLTDEGRTLVAEMLRDFAKTAELH